MTPDTLRRIGETCFGPDVVVDGRRKPVWHRAIAWELAIRESRIVREWAEGKNRIPPNARIELLEMVQRHAMTAGKMAATYVDRAAALEALSMELLEGATDSAKAGN